MNVGCPERAPVTEEPESTSALPIDDKLWDAGLTTMASLSDSNVGSMQSGMTDDSCREPSLTGLQHCHRFQRGPWVVLP